MGHRLPTLLLAAITVLLACSQQGPTASGLPAWSVAATPAALTGAPGSTVTTTVTVDRSQGMDSPVDVSLDSPPVGLSSPGMSIRAGADTGELSVEVAPTMALGTHDLTLVANAGGELQTATLRVVVSLAPDFSLALNPAARTVEQGRSTAVTVNLTRVNGLEGDVNLAAAGLPAGVTASFGDASLGSNSTTLTLTVGAATAPGEHDLTVRGTSGSLAKTATLALTVTAKPVPPSPAGGSLDTSFGGDGIVTTAFGPDSPTFGVGSRARGVAVQADGKLVAVGQASENPDSGDLGGFALARYHPDGSLDASFGGDGLVTTSFGPDGGRDVAQDAVVQADGKIVVAGHAVVVSSSPYSQQARFGLARYDTDGTLDATFGAGGLVTTAVGELAQANAMALQADGRIVVAGAARLAGRSQTDVALARYTTDGRLDPGFGAGGVVTLPDGPAAFAQDVAVQPDGKIVVAVNRDAQPDDFALLRFNRDGSPDPSFGSGGVASADFGGRHDFGLALALQADGRIVVAGMSWSDDGLTDFAVARFDPNGSLDASFGGDGRVITDFGSEEGAHSVAVQPDGKVVASGSASAGRAFLTARYRPDGSLDASFGNGGRAVTALGLGTEAHALAVQADGRIVVVGMTMREPQGTPGDFAVVRYLP